MPNIKNRNLIAVILVIIFSFGVCLNLLKTGYFSMHDDIQVMRLYEMEKCFLDGQIPCRWVSDMGAGFGYPLFNFYSVFPYYLGVFFRLFGLSYILIVKILFGLSLILSGVFMYFLTREFVGSLGAVVGAVFYVYAPYHAVDIYVRGALAESWAITFFPLIFLSVYKNIKDEKLIWYLLSVLSLALLLLSHNIMSLLFVPLVVIWAIFWLLLMRKRVWWTVSVLVWGTGLASFYLIPAFFEKSLVNVSWLISDYFDFRNHFVSLKQLFIFRSFGYGPSILGSEDKMSFQLGLIYWLSVVIVGFLTILSFLKKSKKQVNHLLVILGIWLISIFMTHAKSVFIWEAIPLLSFVQFPWRFLAISIFAGSFAAASLTSFVKGKAKILLAILLILAVVTLNIGYFRPERFYPKKTDEKILSGESWKEQSMAALLDYLPKNVKKLPKDLAPSSPWVTDGSARVTEFAKRSDFWRFTIDVSGNRPAKVAVPIFDFPRWEILIDQKLVNFSTNNEGIIELVVPSGKHTIVGWFKDTPIRSLANWISIISLAGLILLIIVKEKNEKIV